MSTKNSLKDRIKKPNPTQAFFNSYDTDNDASNNDDNKNVVTNQGNIENDIDINVDNDNKDDHVNNNNYGTYVNNNSDVVVNNDDNNYLRKSDRSHVVL